MIEVGSKNLIRDCLMSVVKSQSLNHAEPTSAQKGKKRGILAVCKKNSQFLCNDEQPTFLVGANQAWFNYATGDFGNRLYFTISMIPLQTYLTTLKAAGLFLHIEGQGTPMFGPGGTVIGTDLQQSLIPELMEYLKFAHMNQIFVFICLWNGAYVTPVINERLHGLIKDEVNLQSYILTALTPIVTAVMNEPAMAGWDIINQPEGVMKRNVTDKNPCWDNTFLELKSSGRAIGWAKELFINLQASAIRKLYKAQNKEPLITASSFNIITNTFQWNCKNLYHDYCLNISGGADDGYLSFWSTYSFDIKSEGRYDDWAPFNHYYTEYHMGGDHLPPRPLVIAGFNQVRGRPHSKWDIVKQFNHLYSNGYSGGWTWQMNAQGPDTDDWITQAKGISSLSGKYGVTVGPFGALSSPLGSLIPKNLTIPASPVGK
uniref:Mannan endo-1,4-beta-mannosidase n=1 Tax=Magallana gigas TaxID=29159 RepID=K1RJU5_MAGGI